MAKKKSVRKKVAKKKEVRKKVAKPKAMKVKCDLVKGLFVRLCTLAVVLFVLTVCPRCLNAVLAINPYWYLAAAILFAAIHLSRRRCL